jgi:hypothetical protein
MCLFGEGFEQHSNPRLERLTGPLDNGFDVMGAIRKGFADGINALRVL